MSGDVATGEEVSLPKIFCAMITLMSAGVANAGWTTTGKIKVLRYSTGRILVVHDFMSDPNNCGRSDYFILQETDNPIFKEMYAGLLSAHMTGKPLNLAISGCHLGFPSIAEIMSEDMN